MRSSEINRTRLRTAVLILFLLQTLMLPAAIGVTYASRSLKPEHILTYSAGRLVWDAGTDTDSSGAARLRLFDTAYSHVDSGDGAEVVAPGTEGGSLVRLKNEGGSTVTYTAVLYRLRTEDVPVQAALEGEGFADTAEYALPESAAREDVLRAVTVGPAHQPQDRRPFPAGLVCGHDGGDRHGAGGAGPGRKETQKR